MEQSEYRNMHFLTILGYVFLHVVCLRTVSHAGTFDDNRKLYEDLRNKMDNKIRPVFNQSDAVYVSILPFLTSLQGLNEKEQVLDTTLTLQLRWIQETLTWDPADYGGIDRVRFSPKDIWVPDIVFENVQTDDFLIKKHEDMKIQVSANGEVEWRSGSHLLTSCRVSIIHYPFDIQECLITLGKMYSVDSEVYIVNASAHLTETNPDSNDEWKVQKTSVRTQLVHEGYSVIEITLTLKRRPFFYVLNVILPVLMLAFMNTLCFKIPAQSGERIGYCISLYLTFVVLLNVTADSMPRVSKTVSYLHVYINIQLLLSMISTCLSIAAVKASHIEKPEEQTSGLKLLFGCFRLINREGNLNETTETTVDDDVCKESRNFEPSISSQQNIVSAVAQLDRFFFVVFMLAYLVSTLTCILSLIV